MGISGLLPILNDITTRVHIQQYRGQKAAIDAYSWLHKGAYACSKELCEGSETTKHISYCMQRIALLRDSNITPIVVFDGDRLPMKKEEEALRAKSRKDSLNKARALENVGRHSAAHECYRRAVDISPAVAKALIEALKKEKVSYVVAPYEADAQIAFLALSGRVQLVISEDSDMLAYGCPVVLFKMDRYGEGQQIKLDDLPRNRSPSFTGFTQLMFLEMCVMAGCDFLKGPVGIGIKKAHQHIRRSRNFVRAVKNLRFSGVTVLRDYELAFQKALWTFQHQRVFDEEEGRLVSLHPIPPGGLLPHANLAGNPLEGDPELNFLGPLMPDAEAAAIARGDLDPITRLAFAPLPPAGGTLCRQAGQEAARKFASVQQTQRTGIAALFPSIRSCLAPKSAPAIAAARSPEQELLPTKASQECSVQHRLPARFLPKVAGNLNRSQSTSQPPSQASSQQETPVSSLESVLPKLGQESPFVALASNQTADPLSQPMVTQENSWSNAEASQLTDASNSIGGSRNRSLPLGEGDWTIQAGRGPRQLQAPDSPTDSRAPASMWSFYDVTTPEELGSSPLTCPRKDEAGEVRKRLPLSPVNQHRAFSVEKNGNQEPAKKRKISHFFKKPHVHTDNSLLASQVLPASAEAVTDDPPSQPEGNETQGDKVGGGFHGLSHLPEYTASAAAALKTMAAKHGLHKQFSNPIKRSRRPFVVPQCRGAGTADPAQQSRKGHFGRFMCLN